MNFNPTPDGTVESAFQQRRRNLEARVFEISLGVKAPATGSQPDAEDDLVSA
jgi:hypothetical protein